ncbi:hypothetical protein B566_EDAN003129 [Ephemera danica]|nr:hypothetical protein B566_EDAN003129 [Ephemera danica]
MKYELRYLVQYPEVQQKLRDEVYRVVGTERLPGMDDMPKLHYAQAVLNETLRHSGVLPFPVPCSTPTKNHILGYDVPKETLILLNFWSMNMDTELWGDPRNFRPERFIAEDGTFQKKEFNLPFGLVPRLCMGETVAKQTMTLIFAAILQRFKFEVPLLGTPPSTQQISGLITSPAPYLETLFVLNLWSLNMDPELWGDPRNFRPERFIAEDGTFQKKEFNLPFGLGPRLCMGETVAKQTMTLIFAAILQRFKFEVPSLGAPPSTQQIPGLITSPAPYLVAIKSAD